MTCHRQRLGLTRGQLHANQPIDNYWIRALPNFMLNTSALGTAHGINSAILRYDGAPEEEPRQEGPKSVNPLREWNLHPLENPAAVCLCDLMLISPPGSVNDGQPGRPHPGGVDHALNLDISVVCLPFGTLRWHASGQLI